MKSSLLIQKQFSLQSQFCDKHLLGLPIKTIYNVKGSTGKNKMSVQFIKGSVLVYLRLMETDQGNSTSRKSKAINWIEGINYADWVN